MNPRAMRALRNLFPLVIAIALIVAVAFRAQAAWTFTNAGTARFTHACAAGTVPTAADDGMALPSLHGYQVVLEAAAGQTLSGGGNLRAYVWEQSLASPGGAWVRYPAADLAVNAALAGQRRGVIGEKEVFGGRGRVAYVTDTVTVSGGTCTIWILGAVRRAT